MDLFVWSILRSGHSIWGPLSPIRFELQPLEVMKISSDWPTLLRGSKLALDLFVWSVLRPDTQLGDWTWKTTPKWPRICLISCIGSQVIWRSSSMSADLYCDLTIELGLKNYPKMTFHMSKSIQWVQSYDHLIDMSTNLYTDLTIRLGL